MTDGQAPFPPADEEEERAARALQQALEGRPAGPDLPQAALEAAALLRFSSDAGRRSGERRTALRQQLLASLPAPQPRAERRGWRLWLGLAVPLVGAAAAVALSVFGGRHWLAPNGAQLAEREVAMAPAAQPAEAAPAAAADEAAPALGGLEAKRTAAVASPQFEQQSRAYRAKLLPKVADARVHAIYAELDRARSTAELETVQTHLRALVSEEEGSSGATADVEPLRQDLFCRLAEVALRLGQAQAALDWARQGLDLDGNPNPFLARLFALQGQARGALGDPDGAAKSYLKALEVNERLLDESLEGP